MGKLVVVFFLGVLVGIGGMYGVGAFRGSTVAVAERESELGDGIVIGGGRASTAGEAIEELKVENARLEKALALAVATAPVEEAEEPGRRDAVSPIMEAMAAFGAEQARTNLAMEASAFAERFGLDEEQQARVSEIMAEVQRLRQEAGMKVFAGKATIGDMVLSDPDNHTALDEAIMGIMGEDQVAAYKVYQDEREAERIEKKVDQDMAGLEAVGGLTDEQREAAWQVFAEANAETRPGNAPEGTDLNDIETWVDGVVEQRIEGLRPILTEEQMLGYEKQATGFRDLMMNLVKAGTGAGGGK
ncbi:MAG: hypothetical protein P8J87_11355 [Verrucomicrobiales bacterium]|nr:hypothetical protein [Verrucomicrobiales bacterium]